MHTDDAYVLWDDNFNTVKEDEIKKLELPAKPRKDYPAKTFFSSTDALILRMANKLQCHKEKKLILFSLSNLTMKLGKMILCNELEELKLFQYARLRQAMIYLLLLNIKTPKN